MDDDPKLSQRYRELPREEPPRALDDAILVASRRALTRRRWYVPLATAAVLAVGIGWLQRPAAPPVFRGVELRMGLEVEIGGGALRARWQPVADASGYELQLLGSDGRVLRSLETDGTAATVELGAANGGSAPAFVEVSALDEVGQTLRRSERVPLPER